MAKLILLRHGESVWNALNLFTGWVDVPLSLKGIEEAFEAGRTIKDIPIDIVYVSALNRAIMTAMLVMSMHNSKKVPVMVDQRQGDLSTWGKIHNPHAEANTIPVISAWQINERMYGDLQGLNKEETRAKYGADQVLIWRRSFDIAPPGGESLKDTADRSIPYFDQQIMPHLEKGKNVLVSAHGNSLRSIMMRLDGLSPEEVVALELSTGRPVIYDYDKGQFKKVSG